MQITDEIDALTAAEGVVEMHGPTTGHQKDMLHTGVCDQAKNVIRKLHY
jgi:hypothetical protein